jgi:hypothetical protein
MLAIYHGKQSIPFKHWSDKEPKHFAITSHDRYEQLVMWTFFQRLPAYKLTIGFVLVELLHMTKYIILWTWN